MDLRHKIISQGRHIDAGAFSDPVLLITHYCSFKSVHFILRVWQRLEEAGFSPALKKRRALRSKWFYYRQALYSQMFSIYYLYL